MYIKKSKAIEVICCNLCTKGLDFHGCESCGIRFKDGEEIYCAGEEEHYHSLCKPKTKTTGLLFLLK